MCPYIQHRYSQIVGGIKKSQTALQNLDVVSNRLCLAEKSFHRPPDDPHYPDPEGMSSAKDEVYMMLCLIQMS